MERERRRHRSSILKIPRPRNPLSELDAEQNVDDDRTKRVSFSATKGVALFTTDNGTGTTIWHNFYQEPNKHEVSESSDVANSLMQKLESSIQNQPSTHDVPPTDDAFVPADDEPEESDHCVDISAMVKGLERSFENNAISHTLSETMNPTMIDHTEALLNYKISNNVHSENSSHGECEMSITQAIPAPVLDSKEVKPKKQNTFVYPVVKNTKESWIQDRENIHIPSHMDGDDDNYNMHLLVNKQIFEHNENDQRTRNRQENLSNDNLNQQSCDISFTTGLKQIIDELDDTPNENVNENRRSLKLDRNAVNRNSMADVSVMSSLFQIIQDLDNKENLQVQASTKVSSKTVKQANNEIQVIDNDKENKMYFNQTETSSTRQTLPNTKILKDENVMEFERFEDKENLACSDDESLCDSSISRFIPSLQSTAIEQIDDCKSNKTVVTEENDRQQSMAYNSKFDKNDNSRMARNDTKNTVYGDQEESKFDMSMTFSVPVKESTNIEQEVQESRNEGDRRRTICFNQEDPQCNMSMTAVVFPEKESLERSRRENRRTVIFDQEKSECDMSITRVIPGNQSAHIARDIPLYENKGERRKTIIFDQEEPDCNMSITNIVPGNRSVHAPAYERRKTIVFDQEGPDCNMSITHVVPGNKFAQDTIASDKSNERRKTIIFDQGEPDCNMSITNIVPRNQSVHAPVYEKCNERRKTIIFDPKEPDCDMSITNIVPGNQSVHAPVYEKTNEKRKAIIFDQGEPDCNMSITNIVPANQSVHAPVYEKSNERRKTIIFDQGEPDCNMSITNIVHGNRSVYAPVHEKRKTIIFDQRDSDSNMSITHAVPGNPFAHIAQSAIVCDKSNERRKTIIFDQGEPDCNMSITNIVHRNQSVHAPVNEKCSERRKTIIFDPKEPDCDMSITNIVPGNQPVHAPVYEKTNEKRKTIIFDQGEPDCNMSITNIVPANQSVHAPVYEKSNERRKTIIFDQGELDCNMSITHIVPGNQSTSVSQDVLLCERRKTIIFDQKQSQCDMSMTCAIPNKKIDNANHIIPYGEKYENVQDQSQYFNQEQTRTNMSMPHLASENKSININKSIYYDENTQVKERNRTLLFDNKGQSQCDMSMTCAMTAKISMKQEVLYDENDYCKGKRNTICFNQDETQCNMSITCAVPNKRSVDSKQVALHDENGQIMEKREEKVLIDAEIKRKDKTLYFDEQSQCNMSMTCAIPNRKSTDTKQTFPFGEIEEIRKRDRMIYFDEKPRQSDMSITCAIPNKDVEKADKTLLFDQRQFQCNTLTTSAPIKEFADTKREVSYVEQNSVRGRRKTMCFNQEDSQCNMSTTYAALKVKTVEDPAEERRKIINFEREQTQYDMSITCAVESRKSVKPRCDVSKTFDNERYYAEKQYHDSVQNQNTDEKCNALIFSNERFESNKSPVNVLANKESIDYIKSKQHTPLETIENIRCKNIDQDQCNYNSDHNPGMLSMEALLQMVKSDENIHVQSNDDFVKNEKEQAFENFEKSLFGDISNMSVSNNDAEKNEKSEIQNTIHEISNVSQSIETSENKIEKISEVGNDFNVLLPCESAKIANIRNDVQTLIVDDDNHDRQVVNDLNEDVNDTLHMSVDSSMIFDVIETEIRQEETCVNQPESNCKELQETCERKTITVQNCSLSHEREQNDEIETPNDVPNVEHDVIATNEINISKKIDGNVSRDVIEMNDHNVTNELNTDASCSKVTDCADGKNSIHDVSKNESVNVSMRRANFAKRKFLKCNKEPQDQDSSKLNCSLSSPMAKKVREYSSPSKIIESDIVETVPVVEVQNENDGAHQNVSLAEVRNVDILSPIEKNEFDLLKPNSKRNSQDANLDLDVNNSYFGVAKQARKSDEFHQRNSSIMEDSLSSKLPTEVDDNKSNEDSQNIDNITDISLVNSSIEKSDADEDLQKSNFVPTDEDKFDLQDTSNDMTSNTKSFDNNSNIELSTERVLENILLLNMNRLDCSSKSYDEHEWVFSLFHNLICLRIQFAPLPNEKAKLNMTTPVSDITLECLPVEKFDFKTFHACKVIMNELQVDRLKSLCTTCENVPNLLEHCANVSAMTRKWMKTLHFLYLQHGLDYEDEEKFSFQIASGPLRCIWRVYIRTNNLPFAEVEDVNIEVCVGKSKISKSALKVVVQNTERSWDYMKNLVDNLYSFIRNFSINET